MSNQIRLYYGHDPMCSFCWAFRPIWTDLQKQLAARMPQIEIIYVMGGLAPDSVQPMPEELKNKLMATWRYIQQHIPGTEFNYDFWTLQQPRRSTYPSCRAVMAAKILDPLQEEPMILAIQQAYYQQAKNPSDDNTLVDCAETIGLDRKQFIQMLGSTECDAAFTADRAHSRKLGISSFPSLILAKGSSRFSIPVDYNDASITMERIEQASRLL